MLLWAMGCECGFKCSRVPCHPALFPQLFPSSEWSVELIAVPVILSSLHWCTHGGLIEEIFSAALPYISGSEPYHLSRRSTVTVELTQRSARRKKKKAWGPSPQPQFLNSFLMSARLWPEHFFSLPPSLHSPHFEYECWLRLTNIL